MNDNTEKEYKDTDNLYEKIEIKLAEVYGHNDAYLQKERTNFDRSKEIKVYYVYTSNDHSAEACKIVIAFCDLTRDTIILAETNWNLVAYQTGTFFESGTVEKEICRTIENRIRFLRYALHDCGLDTDSTNAIWIDSDNTDTTITCYSIDDSKILYGLLHSIGVYDLYVPYIDEGRATYMSNFKNRSCTLENYIADNLIRFFNPYW